MLVAAVVWAALTILAMSPISEELRLLALRVVRKFDRSSPGILIVASLVGAVIGYIWLIRSSTADTEPDQWAWRYRDVRAVAPPRDGGGMTRGQRGRRIGRALIAVAVGLTAATALLLVAAPHGPSPMFVPGWLEIATMGLYGVAITGLVVGLVWMIRIHRANPEPDQRAWRYRERD